MTTRLRPTVSSVREDAAHAAEGGVVAAEARRNA